MPVLTNLPPLPVKRIGMVARWRPVHLGQSPVLRALCRHSQTALIGIGSANRYNWRNPFTVAETTEMIRLVLPDQDNYQLIPVPDLDDGPRWRQMVRELFGPLDLYVTENPYVARLMQDLYPVLRPVMLVPDTERVPISGTLVRRLMARGDGWQELVPDAVTGYIIENGLDERFRQQFGLETLAMELREG